MTLLEDLVADLASSFRPDPWRVEWQPGLRFRQPHIDR